MINIFMEWFNALPELTQDILKLDFLIPATYAVIVFIICMFID